MNPDEDRSDHSDERQLMTVGEVASLLRMHPKTVYDRAARGDIPCLKIGRSVRFSRNAIGRWLRGHMEGTS